jgi:hypothetical protein
MQGSIRHVVQKIASLLVFLLILTCFVNCGEDESPTSVTYSIDGENQKVRTVTAYLQFSTDYDHEGRTLYITAANGSSIMLSIAIANWDFQNPPNNGLVEKTYDATFDYESGSDNEFASCLELTGNNADVHLCDGALVTYIGESDIYFSAFDNNTQATVTLTDCNPSKKTMSGTFTAKVQNFSEDDDFVITGEFKNVKYSIFN